jgi:uncharacterized OB-fold protein
MSNSLNDTLAVAREAPEPRSFSRRFWEATRDKKLLIQYCRRSGRYQFYPRATSVADGHRDLEWREVSGRGEIFSYTVARRARAPFQGHEPFAIVVVTLEEGVQLMANLVHCELDEIRIGMAVMPCWAPLPDGSHLLMFEPAR